MFSYIATAELTVNKIFFLVLYRKKKLMHNYYIAYRATINNQNKNVLLEIRHVKVTQASTSRLWAQRLHRVYELDIKARPAHYCGTTVFP